MELNNTHIVIKVDTFNRKAKEYCTEHKINALYDYIYSNGLPKQVITTGRDRYIDYCKKNNYTPNDDTGIMLKAQYYALCTIFELSPNDYITELNIQATPENNAPQANVLVTPYDDTELKQQVADLTQTVNRLGNLLMQICQYNLEIRNALTDVPNNKKGE